MTELAIPVLIASWISLLFKAGFLGQFSPGQEEQPIYWFLVKYHSFFSAIESLIGCSFGLNLNKVLLIWDTELKRKNAKIGKITRFKILQFWSFITFGTFRQWQSNSQVVKNSYRSTYIRNFMTIAWNLWDLQCFKYGKKSKIWLGLWLHSFGGS